MKRRTGDPGARRGLFGGRKTAGETPAAEAERTRNKRREAEEPYSLEEMLLYDELLDEDD